GWNNSPVTLSWRCSPLLPLGLPTVSQTLFVDGQNQSASGFCSSPFGFASDTQSGINIDTKPPTTTFAGKTPAPNTNATGSFLTFRSDAGDYIGLGMNQFYTAGDSAVSATLPRGGDTFTAFFNQGNFTHWWNVTLAAPPGEPLAPGHYDGAVRAFFRPAGTPGLDVYGDGRGCSQLSGSFDVPQVSFTPGGDLQTFDATF